MRKQGESENQEMDHGSDDDESAESKGDMFESLHSEVGGPHFFIDDFWTFKCDASFEISVLFLKEFQI